MHPLSAAAMRCIGVDFSSRPTRRKPVLLAEGERRGAQLQLQALHRHPAYDGLAAALAAPGPWVGAFDFPFGLPRELVESLRWPTSWLPLMRHYRSLDRDCIRLQFKAFCAGRPPGAKFAHRACDRPAGSSPSMKWVNPPVAWMLHAGVPLLIDAGVHLPGLHDGDRGRVALEGYPGLLARELIGARSYKADDAARQTTERWVARQDIVAALEQGRTRLGLRLALPPALRERLVEDASGDSLDAVLCLMQAAWASGRPGWGLPAHIDPLEGWIVSA
ncbi:MAG TPA: DUF429 domain-containing protein [Rubrivivax sp.]|nr:DUF429 domain-containing protein [Rubrivivax sp.]